MSLRPLTSLELRRLIRTKYGWPGGYEIVFYTTDGGVLCADCCRREYRQIAWSRKHAVNDGWYVVAAQTSDWIEESCLCDHCSRELCGYELEEETT